MASNVGKLEEFNKETMLWSEFIERLDEYFVANDLSEEDVKQRAILLSSVGAVTYSLIRNLLAPVKPNSKTYKEIVDLVQKHVSPKPLVIAERFKINNRKQQDSESVSDYMCVLRRMAETCKFADFLNESLSKSQVSQVKTDSKTVVI